jgi:hypothetical protein
MKDYRNTKFKPENDSILMLCNMNSILILQENYELVPNKIDALSLRGGYRFEQSPYKKQTTIET